MKTIRVYKETSDNWYGNFSIKNDARFVKADLVMIKFFKLLDNKTYRVCVWGNDDFGMEYDTKDKDKAKKIFSKIILQPVLEKVYLEQMGFKRS